MSALTDLFQSMANKIRSKTGTATTYTPPQMVADGIDDVYDAGVASATSPITPSDSSPVAMSANTGYKPTRGGYAIESNPTSLTPSDISPVAITSDTIYSAQTGGKAVETITTLLPSNSDPQPLYPHKPYWMGAYVYPLGIQGYAIATAPESKTPSDTSPASVTSGSIIKPSGAGYLVKTVSKIAEQPDKIYTANSVGTSGTTTISVTKKPRYAFVSCVSEANSNYIGLYMFDFTKSKAWYLYKGGSSASFTSNDFSSRISEMFSTVSSSQVVFQNNSFGTTKRLAIALYY